MNLRSSFSRLPRTLFIFLWLLLCSSVGFSQDDIVVLADGRQIVYKSIKERNDIVTIRTVSDEKIVVNYTDLKCKCNRKTGLESFFLKLPPNLYPKDPTRVFYKTKSLTRLLPGRIEVLSTSYGVEPIVSQSAGVYYSSWPDLYAVKGSTVVLFRYGKKRGRAFLDSLTSDAPVPLTFDTMGGFNPKEIMEYLKNYNFQFFNAPARTDYLNKGTVQFFLRTKSDQKLTMQVNDSITYDIPTSYPLSLDLPVNTPSKICIRSDKGIYFELITGSVCTVKYYEIWFNERQTRFEVKVSTLQDIQNFLKWRRKS